MVSSHRLRVSTLKPKVGSLRPRVGTLRPRVGSITKNRPRVNALRPRVGFLRAMVSSHRPRVGPSDLGLVPLKQQFALLHKIDLELTPSYLGLSSSQKVIDLRLAPLHTIRVRVRIWVQKFPHFKNSPTCDIIALPKTLPNDPSYTTYTVAVPVL